MDGAILKPIWTTFAEASKAWYWSNVDANRSVESAASVKKWMPCTEFCLCSGGCMDSEYLLGTWDKISCSMRWMYFVLCCLMLLDKKSFEK